eukprot:s3257_g5.t1
MPGRQDHHRGPSTSRWVPVDFAMNSPIHQAASHQSLPASQGLGIEPSGRNKPIQRRSIFAPWWPTCREYLRRRRTSNFARRIRRIPVTPPKTPPAPPPRRRDRSTTPPGRNTQQRTDRPPVKTPPRRPPYQRSAPSAPIPTPPPPPAPVRTPQRPARWGHQRQVEYAANYIP